MRAIRRRVWIRITLLALCMGAAAAAEGQQVLVLSDGPFTVAIDSNDPGEAGEVVTGPFTAEIQGQTVPNLIGVSIGELEFLVTASQGGKAYSVSKATLGDVEMRAGVGGTLGLFNEWHGAATKGPSDARRPVSVRVLGTDGEERIRYELVDCVPESLDSTQDGSGVASETLHLSCERVELDEGPIGTGPWTAISGGDPAGSSVESVTLEAPFVAPRHSLAKWLNDAAMGADASRDIVVTLFAPDGSQLGTRTFSGSVPVRYRFPELAPGATRLERLEFQPAAVSDLPAGASSNSAPPVEQEETAPPESGESEAAETAPPQRPATQRWGPCIVILRDGKRIDALGAWRSGGTTTVQLRSGARRRFRDAAIERIIPRR